MAVKSIRPHIVFGLVDENIPIYAKFEVPNRHTYRGSPLALEKFILFSLVRFSKCKKIFEFGTFMGTTSKLFYDNTDDDTVIYTIDIGAQSEKSLTTASNEDIELIQYRQSNPPSSLEGYSRIFQIIGDSTEFDYNSFVDFDFVWIDGGHDLHTVESDTSHAFQMLSKFNQNAVIAWHDYGSPLYPELTRFIDNLALRCPIYRVVHTQIAFCLPNSQLVLDHSVY